MRTREKDRRRLGVSLGSQYNRWDWLKRESCRRWQSFLFAVCLAQVVGANGWLINCKSRGVVKIRDDNQPTSKYYCKPCQLSVIQIYVIISTSDWFFSFFSYLFTYTNSSLTLYLLCTLSYLFYCCVTLHIILLERSCSLVTGCSLDPTQ